MADCCDLDRFTNFLSISNSGKTLNEGLRANVFSSSIAKLQCSATWFLVATGFLEAVTQQHQQQRQSSSAHRSEVSPKLQGLSAFHSFQHCQGGTLHSRSDPLQKWKLWREWLSHSGHCLTHACVLSVRYWWSKKTGLLPECPINWQHWQDIELEPKRKCPLLFQHGNSCSILGSRDCPELEQATWFLVRQGLTLNSISQPRRHPSNQRICGVWHKVKQCLSFPQISTLRKETLFIDLTLRKNGNSGENGSLSHNGSLADTRRRALSSVLVIDMNWIANSGRDTELRRRAKVVWCSAHSLLGPVQCSATWFLIATGWFLEALTEQHWQPRQSSSATRSQVSAKLQAFSDYQQYKRGKLFIDLTLCRNGCCDEGNGSLHSGHWLDTCMCALSSELVMDKYWLAVWTPLSIGKTGQTTFN